MLAKPSRPEGETSTPQPPSEDLRHEQDIGEALRQRTALLHEVDHRVKNNLQLIASLLLLQCRRVEDPGTRAALRSMLERVNAVAAVHRRLVRTENLERLDVAEFVRDLTMDLGSSLGRDGITLRLDLETVAIPAAQAAPLALVVNEIVANALKHGFPGDRSGTVDVAIRSLPEGFEIVVADDGVGDADAAPGFGSTIVDLLCRQLRARSRMEATQPGRRVTVTLPSYATSG